MTLIEQRTDAVNSETQLSKIDNPTARQIFTSNGIFALAPTLVAADAFAPESEGPTAAGGAGGREVAAAGEGARWRELLDGVFVWDNDRTEVQHMPQAERHLRRALRGAMHGMELIDGRASTCHMRAELPSRHRLSGYTDFIVRPRGVTNSMAILIELKHRKEWSRDKNIRLAQLLLVAASCNSVHPAIVVLTDLVGNWFFLHFEPVDTRLVVRQCVGKQGLQLLRSIVIDAAGALAGDPRTPRTHCVAGARARVWAPRPRLVVFPRQVWHATVCEDELGVDWADDDGSRDDHSDTSFCFDIDSGCSSGTE